MFKHIQTSIVNFWCLCHQIQFSTFLDLFIFGLSQFSYSNICLVSSRFFVVLTQSCTYSLLPVQVQSNEFPLTLLLSGEACSSTFQSTLWSKISIRLSTIHSIVKAALFWSREMLNTCILFTKKSNLDKCGLRIHRSLSKEQESELTMGLLSVSTNSKWLLNDISKLPIIFVCCLLMARLR